MRVTQVRVQARTDVRFCHGQYGLYGRGFTEQRFQASRQGNICPDSMDGAQAAKKHGTGRKMMADEYKARLNREGELDVSHIAPVGFCGIPGYRVVTVTFDGGALPSPLKSRARHVPVHAPAAAGWKDGPAAVGAETGYDDVLGVLRAAGDVLKKLPVPREVAGMERVCAVVEVIRDRSDHGAWNKETETRRRPTSAELDVLDRVLVWLLWLDAAERKVVWCYMIGLGVRRTAQEIGLSKSQCHRVLQRAVAQIVGWIDG